MRCIVAKLCIGHALINLCVCPHVHVSGVSGVWCVCLCVGVVFVCGGGCVSVVFVCVGGLLGESVHLSVHESMHSASIDPGACSQSFGPLLHKSMPNLGSRKHVAFINLNTQS